MPNSNMRGQTISTRQLHLTIGCKNEKSLYIEGLQDDICDMIQKYYAAKGIEADVIMIG